MGRRPGIETEILRLKAEAYDIIAVMERAQSRLNAINQALNRLQESNVEQELGKEVDSDGTV